MSRSVLHDWSCDEVGRTTYRPNVILIWRQGGSCWRSHSYFRLARPAQKRQSGGFDLRFPADAPAQRSQCDRSSELVITAGACPRSAPDCGRRFNAVHSSWSRSGRGTFNIYDSPQQKKSGFCMPTLRVFAVVQPMYMSSQELSSRTHSIRENLHKLREAIAKGASQEALLLVSQVSSSTSQLSAELMRFSK